MVNQLIFCQQIIYYFKRIILLDVFYCMCKYVGFQAFLKRLESVKPTPGMTRDEQLADYQRQCRYLGTYNTAIPPVKLKSSKTSGTFLHTTYKFKP